uniref:EGF-like domain-containing protein n=1 Tax=Strongyloides stercoralis TaxID=6248 RepID=A0A0K0DX13_STRER
MIYIYKNFHLFFIKNNIKCLLYFFLLFSFFNFSFSERCPLFFGAYECPKNHTCINGECHKDGKISKTCDNVACDDNFKCFNGVCWPVEGIPCDRNTLIDKDVANALTSDCGPKGKCISGRCRIDHCWNVVCNEDEMCRGGKCYKIIDNFCWNSFNCGPRFKCVNNKCKIIDDIPREKCNCDPGMICKNGQCMMQDNCVNIACEAEEVCIDGVCSSLLGTKCAYDGDCGDVLICKQGICVEDLECRNKCPYDNVCREGLCSNIQGLLCEENSCSDGYECINGECLKNNCMHTVCQIGERCDNGLCIRVEGSFCSHAPRDCGPLFKCINGVCQDFIRDMMIQ